MGEDTQFNLRLSTERKEEWDELAENHPEVSSLSGLVRLAVLNEKKRLNRGEDRSRHQSVDVDLSGVERELKMLTRQIESMNDRVDGLEVMASDSEDLQEASLKVLHLLPHGSEEDIKNRQVEPGTPEERARRTGGESNLVDVLLAEGYDELTAREAITRAMQISGVNRVEVPDGRLRYHWMEGY